MRFLWLSLLLFPFFYISAQALDPSAVTDRRAQLEAELANLEKEIANTQNIIKEKQGESKSLERDIALLDAQIKKAQLEIKARNIAIGNIQVAIGAKNKTITSLDEKIEREKDSLSELLRELYQLGQSSTVEMVLGYDSLSDFFVQEDSFNSIQESLQESFQEIRTNRGEAESQKADLEERRAQELQLKTIQELEKRSVETKEQEKKRILTTTKGQEKAYQKVLDERNKSAAQIRSQLFLLNGSKAIPFEKALEYALVVEKATGVRPAFLLGVIREESKLGENVGTGNWKVDLSHSRCEKQRVAFADITNRLGLNPDTMPVSKKAWYGYCGGAMGPAQFIPTTWLLYESAVSKITGNSPPNPWNPLDAFTASGLLLRDNGAAAKTYEAEYRAALRYLAGSNWNNPAYRFYGDDVMSFAADYQEQIDIISKTASR